ncbi:hypothetical protein MMC19_001094 [Ptychographa xylographoides]|nr:hypothetical protein [Ptychographa xylographoides]
MGVTVRHTQDLLGTSEQTVFVTETGQRSNSYVSPTREESFSFPRRNTIEKPRYGFTHDWLKANLAGRRNDERGNWWSDESGASDTEICRTQRSEDKCGNLESWLGLGRESTTIQYPRRDPPDFKGTPARGAELEELSVPKQSTSSRHRTLLSDLTVKQKDFDQISLGSQEVEPQGTASLTTRSGPLQQMPTMDLTIDMPKLLDKPLPSPPVDRTISEAPPLIRTTSTERPSNIKRPSLSSLTSFQRPRKRVVWRGKTCVIALPLGNGSSKASRYLSQEDNDIKIADWETQGFSTLGFDLLEQSHGQALGHGQSRDIYPDSQHWHREWQEKGYKINIPDITAWDDYVAYLTEEKLRALGVTSADEDKPSGRSPGLQMRELPSSKKSMLPPSLPPALTSEMAARSQIGPISSHFTAGSNPAFDRPSMVSAQSLQYANGAERPHMPKQSISYQNSQLMPSPSHFSNQQPTPPGSGPWSDQQYFSSLPGSRGVSPLIGGRRQSLHGTLSPVSPMPDMAFDRYFHSQNTTLPPQQPPTYKDFQSQYQPLPHQERLPLHQPTPSRSINLASTLHSIRYVSQPEIASPLPQGHRHNLSESLQKEIDNAEYHLEESIRRQLDEEDELSLRSAVCKESPVHPINSNGNGTAKSSKQTTMSDLDTDPITTSSLNTPTSDRKQREIASSVPRHVPKASISKLNVKAPEFVFDPKKSLAPSTFVFSGSLASESVPSLQAKISNTRSSQKSSGLAVTSNLNVSAPSFTPRGDIGPTVLSREFSFSSSIPKLKPDAPIFKPGGAGLSVNSGSELSGSENGVPKIFGKFDFSEVLPGRRSKAIPIVKPDEDRYNGDIYREGQEDMSGRITQADGRQKRIRRYDGDGDQVPLFATPSHDMPWNTPIMDGKQEDVAAASHTFIAEPKPLAEAQVSPTEKATDQLIELVDRLHSPSPSSSTQGLGSANISVNDLEAFEFEDPAQAATFSVALPRPPIPAAFQTSNAVKDCELNKVTASTSDAYSSSAANSQQDGKPAVSATVQPLEYAADAINIQAASGSISVLPSSRIPSGALAASRYAFEATSERSLHSMDSEQHHGDEVIVPEEYPAEESEYMAPSFQEIDAVMQQLNDDSDIGVERFHPTSILQSRVLDDMEKSPVRSVADSLIPEYPILSDSDQRLFTNDHRKIPSSSPNRLQQPFQYLPERSYGSSESAAAEMIAKNARFSPSYKPSRRTPMSPGSPVHQLNTLVDLPISDWDDVVSSGEEAHFHTRTQFFDHRVNNMIGGIVQQQMQPLVKNLSEMSTSLAQLSNRSTSWKNRQATSAEVKDSDADDEDDEDKGPGARTRSPLKDRKYEKLKASLLENLSAQQIFASSQDFAKILATITELKTSVEKQKPSLSSDLKSIVEEAIKRQMRGTSAPIVSSHDSATIEKAQLHITGLESMLKIADSRANDETKARRTAEDELAECQRMLRLAEADAAQQHESAEETERSLTAFHDERLQTMHQYVLLKDQLEESEKSNRELAVKITALEDTLEEYRLSSTQWRKEVEEESTNNRNLNRTIHALKEELQDGIKGRHGLRDKLSRLQEEMSETARKIAQDQSSWRYKEEEHRSRYELQNARLEAEARTRERLELEIERLESQEKEAMKSRFLIEQIQGENGRLVALVNGIKAENDQIQKDSARYQRELHDVKETASLDIQRVQNAIEADTEKADQQVRIVRNDLESVVARLQTQLGDAKADMLTIKSRSELMLEEACESKDTALRNAAESREAALQEHYRFHERTLDELKSQHERALAAVIENNGNTLRNASESHAHTLTNAMKERALMESRLNDLLSLADEKILHYQDRISHLEEKLEITKSAAQAAVQAVQSARASPSPTAARNNTISVSRGSDVDGKISPQALRESILVLQEQLHDRESQIERLGQDLDKVDKNAPTKIRERDYEISWLRELLGVRVDDLQDIISTLSQPNYDRDAIMDAVIRLKTNLQMEQQEKERAMAGGQTFPSLASLSSIAASPRALPLAAAAAWGNWRKGQSTFASLSEMANGSTVGQTPSKSSPQSFLSGLLTPPSTSLRQTPQPPLGPGSTLSERHDPKRAGMRLEKGVSDQQLPETPRLLRKQSYDLDAEQQDGHYSLERYVKDDADSMVGDRNVSVDQEEDGPFGPSIRA